MWQAFRRFKKDECSRTRAMLSGYMDRRLNPEELTRVEEHLRTCQGCREELESLRATVALLHRLPEVTPSRSFAVAPVKPVPGRRALRGLRFATAGAAVLLVLAFAADRTDLFQQNPFSNPQFGPSTLDFGSARTSEEGESYWVVSGVKNSVDPQSETPVDVDLVVPDGSDNVYVAVRSLTYDGVIYGTVEAVPDETLQLVVTESASEADARGEADEYTVVQGSAVQPSKFATNSTEAPSAIDSIIKGQVGTYLNMVPAASDNSVLYSFYLERPQREFKAAPDHDWLRPLEYGLIGMVVVLGGATLALWFRQRRRKAAEVG